ncbi:protein of unknown function [Nitrospina watsonii]|uniref:Uncharacterized protein n=1 Tax=Nitrospina watsonii TaxID=1323948 RepID=A0ABM9HAW8_9BACT|nr:protein of unknown function [Nitrospina watsonii]
MVSSGWVGGSTGCGVGVVWDVLVWTLGCGGGGSTAGSVAHELKNRKNVAASAPGGSGRVFVLCDWQAPRRIVVSVPYVGGLTLALHVNDGLVGQLIGAFVLWMPRMAAHPFPGDAVGVVEAAQFLPQLLVLDRFFGAGGPVAAHPVVHPFGHAFDQVLGVGVQLHLAGLLEFFEGDDGRRHFHDVVGGAGVRAFELLLAPVLEDESAVSARTGVALAGAVGINENFFHEERLILVCL